jgi:hypothetical protein
MLSETNSRSCGTHADNLVCGARLLCCGSEFATLQSYIFAGQDSPIVFDKGHSREVGAELIQQRRLVPSGKKI